MPLLMPVTLASRSLRRRSGYIVWGFLRPASTPLRRLTIPVRIKVHATATAESAISGSAATAAGKRLGVREVRPTALLASAAVRDGGTIAAAARAFAEGWVFAGAAAKATVLADCYCGRIDGSIASIHLINWDASMPQQSPLPKQVQFAIAAANAMGLFQAALDARLCLGGRGNAGTINVIAHADAVGAIGIASARAAGSSKRHQPLSVKSGVAVKVSTTLGRGRRCATASAHGGAFAWEPSPSALRI